MRSLLILLALLGYCSTQLVPDSVYNQTVACNFCGKQVYFWLQDEPEDTISALRTMTTFSLCPTYFPFLQGDFCGIALQQLLAVFYRPWYAVNFPFRDQICQGVCGHSGANYTTDY